MTRTDYRPRPLGLRRRRPVRRPVVARSAALLREVTFPARVLAWWCPRCRDWVNPATFLPTSGLCQTCTDHTATSTVKGAVHA